MQLQIKQPFNQTFEEICFLEGKGKKEENTMFHLHKVWGQNLEADLPDLKNDLKQKSTAVLIIDLKDNIRIKL